MDEYFVRKRTQAVQLFMGRCVRHVKIRDHPLFRAFLEMSSPVCYMLYMHGPGPYVGKSTLVV